jgi:hypothetical protein
MNPEQKPQSRSLRDIELEVEAQGREWMRKRLEERLQAEADRDGGVFPPQRAKSQAPAKRDSSPKERRRSR